MEASDKILLNPTPVKPVEGLKRQEPNKIGELGAGPRDTRFKDLLEDIERLRIQGKQLGTDQNPVATTDAEDLDQALDLADRTHENAMNMRRRLEDAFRRHMTS